MARRGRDELGKYVEWGSADIHDRAIRLARDRLSRRNRIVGRLAAAGTACVLIGALGVAWALVPGPRWRAWVGLDAAEQPGASGAREIGARGFAEARRPPAFALPSAPVQAGGKAEALREWSAAPSRAFVDSVGLHVQKSAAAKLGSATRRRIEELGVRQLATAAQARPPLEWMAAVAPPGASILLAIRDFTVTPLEALALLGPRLRSVQLSRPFGRDWVDILKMDEGWAVRDSRVLFELVRSTPALAHLRVVGPAIQQPFDTALFGDLEAWVDEGAFESRPGPLPPEGALLDEEIARARRLFPGKPIVAAKASYCTGATVRRVSEAAQARYIPRILLTHFDRQVLRTYLAPFVDGASARGEDDAGCGLLRSDGSPKAAFGAVKTLLRLMQPEGTGGAARLSMALVGAPADLHSVLLHRADGAFVLALWLARTSGDEDAEIPVTVRFATPMSTVTWLDLRDDRAPHSWQQVSDVSVQVSDAARLLVIAP